MSDYINREDALDAICNIFPHSCQRENCNYGCQEAQAIVSISHADVKPVIRGEWIKMSDADGVYWACSECGEDIPRITHFNPQFDLFPKLKSIEKTSFCPNCGAEMAGE